MRCGRSATGRIDSFATRSLTFAPSGYVIYVAVARLAPFAVANMTRGRAKPEDQLRMKADLFLRRRRWSDELFDGIEDNRKLTRDFPIARSTHQPTNAVHPAASPHAVLLVVFLVQSFDFPRKVTVGIHEPPQLHKSAHNGNIYLDRARAAQDARKHGDALFGECVRRPATASVET